MNYTENGEGLPSELHKIITGVLKATETTIEDIFKKSKALDKRLFNRYYHKRQVSL